ncbi:MAG: YIP1 family protein [Anaeromyxobacteraceae bacterium]
MLARCARCQNDFTTDRFGLQKCPHCGSDLMLADPNATAPAPPAPPPSGAETLPPPPPSNEAFPPPPPPPAGGYGPPPGGTGGSGGGGFGGPPPGGRGPEGIPSPWVERDRLGFFNGYVETWKLVATKPQDFFGRVRIDRPGSAVLFGVIGATIGQVVSALYSWAAGAQAMVAMRQMIDQMGPEQAEFLEKLMPYMGGAGTAYQMIAAPVSALVGIYLGGGIIHLLLMLFKGAGRGFDATITVVGYAMGLQLLAAVPACGSLIAAVWVLVAYIIGLAAAQRTTTGKAAAAVLTPLVLACCCCGGIIGAGAAAALKALGAATGKPVDV